MLHSLYLYVRAGELPLALDLCRKSDQSWRAASLSGGNLWQDPAIMNSKLSSGYGDEMDEGMMNGELRARGNRQRALWKKMCKSLSGNVSKLILSATES